MDVEVFNQTITGRKTHVGKNSTTLKSVIISLTPGQEIIEVPLTYDNKKLQGVVSFKSNISIVEINPISIKNNVSENLTTSDINNVDSENNKNIKDQLNKEKDNKNSDVLESFKKDDLVEIILQ